MNDRDSLTQVAHAVDGLVVLTRAGLRRAILALAACAFLLFGSAVSIGVILVKTSRQTGRIEALAQQLEALASDQAAARRTTEEVKQKVDTAAEKEAAKPTVEILPAASAKPGRPNAVVVIKPAHTAQPKAAPIEIPVQLPPGSKVQTEDGGPEKK